jgi:hypothetical protein
MTTVIIDYDDDRHVSGKSCQQGCPAMKVTRVQAAENRRCVAEASSRLFQQRRADAPDRRISAPRAMIRDGRPRPTGPWVERF